MNGNRAPTALLFSGQGNQSVGMGATLLGVCPSCRATLQEADTALGVPLSRLMAEGPEHDLRRTAIAQPAILTLGVAQARHLLTLGIRPQMLVGHSLGQYSALVVAGSLDFASTVRLVAARGDLMQQTIAEGTGAMAAIVGLERDEVYAACATVRALGVVTVACHNAPGQTVISGASVAVAAAGNRCERMGGVVVALPVSVPFHCDLLRPMIPAFMRLIQATEIANPMLPVIDNVTALPLLNARAVRESLIAQITAPVLMEESVRYLAGAGIHCFIQCGPGTSLLGFAKRIVGGAECRTFDDAAAGAMAEC